MQSSINSTHSTNRNGGQFHRGIEFLRNAFWYKNGNTNANDNESTDYRKLRTRKEPAVIDEPHQMTVVGIDDNAIKRQQNVSNGFVVSDQN